MSNPLDISKSSSLDTLRDWLTGDHATPAAYRMGFVTAEQVLALLDRLEAAERDRDRLRRKIRPCARCGQREVVGRHGELVCCDRCAVEVGPELLAEAYRVDLEENDMSGQVQLRWWRPGGFRLPWLARLTDGRLGLGRWTQAEVDAIQARARSKAEELERYADEYLNGPPVVEDLFGEYADEPGEVTG